MNAQIGQTGAFFAALMAVSMRLFLVDRVKGAYAMALLAIKPSIALAPTLSVLQERPAIWLRYGIAAAVVVFLPFLYFGPDQLGRWLFILSRRLSIDVGGGHQYNQGISSVVGAETGFWIAILALLTLVTLLVTRAVKAKLGLPIAMAFAVFCGCLVNPHSLFYDWGIAFAGIMLLRMSNVIEDQPLADLLFGLLAVSLFIAGQYTWDMRHETGSFLRPLTAWTFVVISAILLATVRQYALDLRRLRLNGLSWLQAARGL
jgi:hypothetical protein